MHCGRGTGSMLSERAKREWKEMAASPRVREEFRLLADAWRQTRAQITIDQYVAFLSTFSRLSPHPPSPRPFTPFYNVRL